MITVKNFVFGPFGENTYILFDETHECAIVDAGCYTAQEQAILKDFIADKKLKPTLRLCTHAHIDHITGNCFVFDTYGLKPLLHKADMFALEAQERVCQMYQLEYHQSPMPDKFIEDGDELTFGNTTLKVLFVPGHSPGPVAFYCAKSHLVICGDVLFKGTVGRTDLPGSNFPDLEKSIKTKLYTLPDETTVYSGHGLVTNIGQEKTHNMFVNAD